jgi:hypothetical protein
MGLLQYVTSHAPHSHQRARLFFVILVLALVVPTAVYMLMERFGATTERVVPMGEVLGCDLPGSSHLPFLDDEMIWFSLFGFGDHQAEMNFDAIGPDILSWPHFNEEDVDFPVWQSPPITTMSKCVTIGSGGVADAGMIYATASHVLGWPYVDVQFRIGIYSEDGTYLGGTEIGVVPLTGVYDPYDPPGEPTGEWDWHEAAFADEIVLDPEEKYWIAFRKYPETVDLYVGVKPGARVSLETTASIEQLLAPGAALTDSTFIDSHLALGVNLAEEDVVSEQLTIGMALQSPVKLEVKLDAIRRGSCFGHYIDDERAQEMSEQ